MEWTTGRAVRRGGAALAAVVLVALVVAGVSWCWPPSPAQEQARAILEARPQWPGSNAYADLALLGVPGLTPGQRQARAEAHARQFERWYADVYVPAFLQDRVPTAPPALVEADARAAFPDSGLCGFGAAAGCVAAVRRDPQATAAALAPHAVLLEQMDALAAHGHFHSPLTQTEATPWPQWQWLQVPLSAHALAHVQGDSARALAGLCRDAGIGRMLMTQGDGLVGVMAGGRLLQANAGLFAEVLAELPVDAPLPPGCTTAFALLSADEVGLCQGMRGEFAMQRRLATLTHRKIVQGRWYGRFFYSARKTLAGQAERLGQVCLPEVRTALAEDRRVPDMPLPAPSWWQPQCLTNALGCTLNGIAAPAYLGFARRQQDVGAQVRLLQALLWLRGQAAQDASVPVAQWLERLPAELRGRQRPLVVSADGGALEVAAHGTPAVVLQMPLPQAMRGR
ncbi:hypothetical protein [Stenotrophomonas mori]|uniref:Uncharacterized protein n=1 Tax=Stenotrophomonas mori TaxID=2871096 RepID=A0ABT0SDU1_9GAMM|nr:hypothetical protein [Stenotrophomonas mori]MCL7713499.1 hypothetical protein [Stenotrophomonas mori]